MHLLFELLLLIPAKIYNSQPNLIKDLLSIVRLNANDSTINKETKKLIQRIIALIYTLTTDENLCKIIRKSLIDAGVIELFDNLSLTSSDKHVRFTCALICWTLSRENMADRKYSPQMIETFVHYLTECGGDPLQQCHGVPLDSMITTLSGTYRIYLSDGISKVWRVNIFLIGMLSKNILKNYLVHHGLRLLAPTRLRSPFPEVLSCRVSIILNVHFQSGQKTIFINRLQQNRCFTYELPL